MSSPQVSIVIPTFNRAKMLKRCIDAALAQTIPCEVIVCDHGSTDETPALAATYGDKIRYLRRAHDSGVHFAWLDGVISARAEYVHLNFDDDLIKPEFAERCLAMMSPQVGFCFTVTEIRDEATQQANSYLFQDFGATGVYRAGCFMSYQIRGLVSPGATLIRRQDILNQLYVGKIPLTNFAYRGVGPDWLMTAMTTLDYPKFAFIAEPLAIFSAHEGSITVDAHRDEVRKKELYRAYQQARLYYMTVRLVRVFRLQALAWLWLTGLRGMSRICEAIRGFFKK